MENQKETVVIEQCEKLEKTEKKSRWNSNTLYLYPGSTMSIRW